MRIIEKCSCTATFEVMDRDDSNVTAVVDAAVAWRQAHRCESTLADALEQAAAQARADAAAAIDEDRRR